MKINVAKQSITKALKQLRIPTPNGMKLTEEIGSIVGMLQLNIEQHEHRYE